MTVKGHAKGLQAALGATASCMGPDTAWGPYRLAVPQTRRPPLLPAPAPQGLVPCPVVPGLLLGSVFGRCGSNLVHRGTYRQQEVAVMVSKGARGRLSISPCAICLCLSVTP